MKLCIVTVYNSINSGSYWQAKSLGTVLTNMGHEVYYLERKGGTSSFYYKVKTSLSKLIRGSVVDFVNRIKEFSEFTKSRKDFNVIKNNSIKFGDIDCFILGSDTIWDLDRSHYSRNHKKYFGGVFNGKKVITYAASAGNTPLKSFQNYKDIPEMLNNIEYISVRDNETYKIVKTICNKNKEISLVCDPTLLLDKDEYKNKSVNIEENKYIFLYLFKGLSKKQNEDLRLFAKDNNLKIISGTMKFSCCDKSIVNSPFTFLNYMVNSEYVVTDTYHGTIFATNLEKNFAVINREKKKVNDFINFINLSDRLVNGNCSIVDILKKKIDYKNVKEKINILKEKSIKYLIDSIN